jgi:hypothetical protein
MIAELPAQNTVFFTKVIDDLQLVLVHPRGDAISTNWNGPRAVGIVSSLSRALVIVLMNQPIQRDPVSGPYEVSKPQTCYASSDQRQGYSPKNRSCRQRVLEFGETLACAGSRPLPYPTPGLGTRCGFRMLQNTLASNRGLLTFDGTAWSDRIRYKHGPRGNHQKLPEETCVA